MATTLTLSDLTGVVGHTAIGPNGVKIGRIEQVYIDAERGTPSFFVVTIGVFGKQSKFVPVSGARIDGRDVHLGYDRSYIKSGPDIAVGDEIDGDTEDRLFRYYSGTFQDSSDAPPPGSAHEAKDRSRTRMRRWDGSLTR